MKVALFGGSFNPIHNGHVKIIKEILARKIADEVWIIPCKNHAFDKTLIDAKHRVNMINLALKDARNAKVCNIELESEGKSYTIDTVKNLKKKHNHEFFWVIGSDILGEITLWRGHEQLFKEIKFIIFKRAGYPIIKVDGMKAECCIEDKEDDVSSTEAREKAKNKEHLGRLVPEEVEKYIKKENLYP